MESRSFYCWDGRRLRIVPDAALCYVFCIWKTDYSEAYYDSKYSKNSKYSKYSEYSEYSAGGEYRRCGKRVPYLLQPALAGF